MQQGVLRDSGAGSRTAPAQNGLTPVLPAICRGNASCVNRISIPWENTRPVLLALQTSSCVRYGALPGLYTSWITLRAAHCTPQGMNQSLAFSGLCILLQLITAEERWHSPSRSVVRHVRISPVGFGL